MSFWKKKSYCEYCGSEKNTDGSCKNPKCIDYKNAESSETGSTTDSKTESKEG